MFNVFSSCFEIAATVARTSVLYHIGMMQYINDFYGLFNESLDSARYAEQMKKESNEENRPSHESQEKLFKMNCDIFMKAYNSSLKAMLEVHRNSFFEMMEAWNRTVFSLKGEDIVKFWKRQERILKRVVIENPQAIKNVESEFGFHFESEQYEMVCETERFWLYQVFPSQQRVKVDENKKPIILIPPYVLGPDVLAMLPSENRSLAHAYANQQFPTFVRIVKDIRDNSSVAQMGLEEEIGDTTTFCEFICKKYGRKVTLLGMCQGGYLALLSMLSGQLKGVADALITIVTPIDGTKSRAFAEYLEDVPPEYNDLRFSMKVLPNGTTVINGKVITFIYWLKNIEYFAPWAKFYVDLVGATKSISAGKDISSGGAAVQLWLKKGIVDVPVRITEVSSAAYNIPITEEGTLPVYFSSKALSLKDLNCPCLICFSLGDDMVEPDAALPEVVRSLEGVETTAFPKGHIAPSTSHVQSDLVNKRFPHPVNPLRESLQIGPVLWHSELDKKSR